MVQDTKQDWDFIGSTEPWYGVLSAGKFLKENLTPEAIEEFYKQGREEIATSVNTLRALFGFSRASVGLDIGSGVGRLTFAMRDYVDSVYGIDVSEGMISEARSQAALRGIEDVRFGYDLQDVEKVDWINSYIVFQHISPEIGYKILEKSIDKLNVGGWISIQITYMHDNPHKTELMRDVKAYMFDGQTMRVIEESLREPGAMSMYDYDLNRIMRIIHTHGIYDTLLRHTNHGGVHGVWIFGRRTS